MGSRDHSECRTSCWHAEPLRIVGEGCRQLANVHQNRHGKWGRYVNDPIHACNTFSQLQTVCTGEGDKKTQPEVIVASAVNVALRTLRPASCRPCAVRKAAMEAPSTGDECSSNTVTVAPRSANPAATGPMNVLAVGFAAAHVMRRAETPEPATARMVSPREASVHTEKTKTAVGVMAVLMASSRVKVARVASKSCFKLSALTFMKSSSWHLRFVLLSNAGGDMMMDV